MHPSFATGLALACLVTLANGTIAQACDDPVTLTTSQVRDGLATLSDAQSDPFSRYLAYQDLSCSDDPVIVGFARQAGLSTGIEPLVESIFQSRLYAMEVLLLEADPTVDLSDEQKNWVKGNPVIRLSLYKSLPEHGCIALDHNRDCRPGAVLSLDGVRLSLSSGNASADLKMGEAGDLKGNWYPGNGLRIPVVAHF